MVTHWPPQREYDPVRRSYEPIPESELSPHQRQLRLWLSFSVPAYLMKWRAEGKSHEEIVQIGRGTADVLPYEGGALLADAARGTAGIAESLAALGRAIAAGSFTPGGIIFLAQHWETNGAEWEADRLQRGAVKATVERRGPKRSPGI